MKKVTIITGEQGVGKTKLARERCIGRIMILSHLDTINIKNIPINTEVIILDEVPYKHSKKKLKALIDAEYITFRPPYSKNQISIKCPDIIVTSTDESLIPLFENYENVEIIKL